MLHIYSIRYFYKDVWTKRGKRIEAKNGKEATEIMKAFLQSKGINTKQVLFCYRCVG